LWCATTATGSIRQSSPTRPDEPGARPRAVSLDSHVHGPRRSIIARGNEITMVNSARKEVSVSFSSEPEASAKRRQDSSLTLLDCVGIIIFLLRDHFQDDFDSSDPAGICRVAAKMRSSKPGGFRRAGRAWPSPCTVRRCRPDWPSRFSWYYRRSPALPDAANTQIKCEPASRLEFSNHPARHGHVFPLPFL